MREDLLGYLIGALEPEERARVERRLQQDPHCRRDVELLNECLDPLRALEEPITPPEGLARRTCSMIASLRDAPHSVETTQQPASKREWTNRRIEPPCDVRRSRMADLAVAAGILFAATLLLFPALEESRRMARLTECANKLRAIGLAIQAYGQLAGGFLPPIEPGQTAGIYAPRLKEAGFMVGDGWNLCPGDPRAVAVYIPTVDEVDAARGAQRASWLRTMGGSYAYTLHHVDEHNRYRCARLRGRTSHVILADAPWAMAAGLMSGHHGGCLQNVLCEDGHVCRLTDCRVEGCRDHIFVNDDGDVAPGRHADDAVVAPSDVSPGKPVRFVAR
jgi:hypothetical protein